MIHLGTMHGNVRFQLAYWPVAIIEFSGHLESRGFDDYLAQLTGVVARRETFALVINAEKIGFLPASLRRRQAQWIRRHAAIFDAYCVGASFVLTSHVARLMYRGVLWLQPIACPHRVCDSYAEAILWTGERLAASHIALPMGLLGHTVRASRA